MRKIVVHLPQASYPIWIGAGVLERLPSLLTQVGLSGKVLVVTDRRVAVLHLSRLVRVLKKDKVPYKVFYLEKGERAKRQEELFRIYRFLLKNRYERQDPVIAFGGGAVGDAAGFAAATYLRGVQLIQAGTTLLAQVDSSIGGKTGINLPEGKNLVGSFYPPRLVVSDTSLLRTLPRQELVSSLAEVIKYGVIRDPGLFRYLENRMDSLLVGDEKSLEEVVFRSARIKAEVVERDEKETRGERMILNYGHTWGHAFEAALNFRGIRHGEAVALGMDSAARLARRIGIFRAEDEMRQNRLIARAGLPTRVKGARFKPDRVIKHMMLDKKKSGGRLRFVLPEAIGRVKVVNHISLADIRRVLSELGTK